MMTIQRGKPWGTTVGRPGDLARAESDAELADWVANGRHGSYGLADGDLYRALGAPPDRAEMQRLPVDGMEVVVDERRMLAVAHVVARHRWWRGPLLAVMNGDHLGAWNVAPRAHPNDGRFDVIEVAPTMSLRSRLQARSRLASGTHLPHPDISVRTATEAAWEFDRPMRIVVDGVDVGRGRRLSVRLLADRFTVHV
jgi:YegS C-terminal NAD kinase beta sandwich-like domain